jgi:hypothetical protein
MVGWCCSPQFAGNCVMEMLSCRLAWEAKEFVIWLAGVAALGDAGESLPQLTYGKCVGLRMWVPVYSCTTLIVGCLTHNITIILSFDDAVFLLRCHVYYISGLGHVHVSCVIKYPCIYLH